MLEKYDINKMFEEIKEDEEMGVSKKEKISQDKIKEMMFEKLKEKKGRK